MIAFLVAFALVIAFIVGCVCISVRLYAQHGVDYPSGRQFVTLHQEATIVGGTYNLPASERHTERAYDRPVSRRHTERTYDRPASERHMERTYDRPGSRHHMERSYKLHRSRLDVGMAECALRSAGVCLAVVAVVAVLVAMLFVIAL